MQMQFDKWRVILLFFVTLFFCLFSLLGLWRHWGYMTSVIDLGSFDQVTWMASRGHSLVNTTILGTPLHWLGIHFHPILFAFVLLYKIIPTVNWFVFLQAGALAISVWPIYLIAERVTDSRNAALMWSLAYLCNPFMLNAAAWDFHPVSLAVPFLGLALLAIECKQISLLVIASIILLACKEQMGLTTAGLGLLYGIRNQAWPVGLCLFLVGIAMFVLIVVVVMPSLSITGQHLMFSEHFNQVGLGRYSWLGGSLAEVTDNIFRHPAAVSKIIFIDRGGFQYIIKLIQPLLFFPVIALPWTLPAVGDLIINLFSSVPLPRSVYSYHSVTLIPVLVVASIHGSQKLTRYMGQFSKEIVALPILLVSLFLGYIHAPLPLPGSINLWRPVNTIAKYDRKTATIRDLIGDASASVQNNIGAHFSQRSSIYRYPDKIGEAEFIILRLGNPSQRNLLLPHLLAMPPSEYLDSVKGLLVGNKYGVVLWDDPWLVFQRSHGSDEYSENIITKIEILRKEWSTRD